MRQRCIAVFLTFLALAAVPARAADSGAFLCESSNNGLAAPATFRLLSGDQQIASGSCGGSKPVPAGRYDAVIILDGAADQPTVRELVKIDAGQTARVQASFETGELLVDVTRGGRRSIGMVHLFRDGQPIGSVGAGSANRLSIGSYAVEIESRGEKRPRETLTIVRGQRRHLVIDFAEAGGKSSQ